jgi:SOS response regulatory protein OraA/RecX
MDTSKFYYSDGVPFHGIFREVPLSGQWIKNEPKEPVYTTKHEDDDLPSAYKIYMDCVNEYEAAVALTPSWEYWKNMLKICVKIRRVIEDWREEKYQRDQAIARRLLWDAAQKGNVSAQKLLYEARKEEREQKIREKIQQDQSTKETEMLENRLARLSELKIVK